MLTGFNGASDHDEATRAQSGARRYSRKGCPVNVIRKQLLVLCPYPEGVAAGQRLKYEQYFDDWRARGYEITVSPFMDDAMWRIVHQPGHLGAKILGAVRGMARRIRDLFRVRRHDGVYVFMWVTPFGTTLFERAVRMLAPRMIYDIEDNAAFKRASEVNALSSFMRGKAKTMYLVRNADHVISSSPFLNDWCLQHNRVRRCTYVSSSVDTTRFVPVNRYANDGLLTIGWTGTFSSRPYLDLLRGVFQQLAQKRKFRLRVIGNFDYELPGVDLEVLRWSEATEVRDLQGIDIGVYPLPDDDWVTGKSGLKAIQYMAFALPTVATAVGTTPRIIRHMHNGMLVKTEQEWLDCLLLLLDDPGLRRRLGEAARETITAGHSVQAIRSQYAAILEEVFG